MPSVWITARLIITTVLHVEIIHSREQPPNIVTILKSLLSPTVHNMISIYKDVKFVKLIIIYQMIELNVYHSHLIVSLLIVQIIVVLLVIRDSDFLYNILLLLRHLLGSVLLLLLIKHQCVLLKIILLT